jgi:ferric iron reductase protein FhuF
MADALPACALDLGLETLDIVSFFAEYRNYGILVIPVLLQLRTLTTGYKASAVHMKTREDDAGHVPSSFWPSLFFSSFSAK